MTTIDIQILAHICALFTTSHLLIIIINYKFIVAAQTPDVMVLNDIIEQAAGRHSRASDHGGKFLLKQQMFCAHNELIQAIQFVAILHIIYTYITNVSFTVRSICEQLIYIS